MFLMNSDGSGSFEFGKGEIATVAATLSFIASTLVTRVGLKGVPLGIFSIYRTVLGTIIYYFLALYLYGPNHFQDLLEPIVLKWVWVYAIIVIIVGQFSWNLGLKHARSGDISLATSFSPVAALIIAMVLLGEDPGPRLDPRWIGHPVGHRNRPIRTPARQSRGTSCRGRNTQDGNRQGT